jgi:hypothetical protein
MLKLVEVEGSHTIQNLYDSLDVHVGQSVSVLVTLNQPPKDYYIVASTRFTQTVLNTISVLHYSNSHSSASGLLPAAPPATDYDWSMKQARTYRLLKKIFKYGFISQIMAICSFWFRICKQTCYLNN